MPKVYTVIVDGEKLKCYETSSSSVVGMFNFSGTVCNGPVVTGDRVTVVFETAAGKTAKVFGLPSFNQITAFTI